MVQNNQESRRKHWATGSSVRSWESEGLDVSASGGSEPNAVMDDGEDEDNS